MLPLLCFLFLMAGERIPLTQMKTMRETLRERNLLTEFSEEHPYSLSQNATNDQNIIYYPLKNYKDVSVLGGWCSTAPPGALTLHWGSRGDASGVVGAGAPGGVETWGNRDPFPEKKAFILSFLSVVTGPSNDQGADKHPFLCQRCIISLRKIVLSELSEPLSYRWRVSHLS